ncbi:hypothetical protein EUGRSUZ_E01543 [Eucalyptus grandis]|uniref:Uncharacterized protein n=2 Tax=Eucalyptus grandis TaxID=71139 RepID=A0ACC3KUX7_EUCGR|nr:hypothetical protein EUGRSUZ_E01543 [Eucalyptus grandis]
MDQYDRCSDPQSREEVNRSVRQDEPYNDNNRHRHQDEHFVNSFASANGVWHQPYQNKVLIGDNGHARQQQQREFALRHKAYGQPHPQNEHVEQAEVGKVLDDPGGRSFRGGREAEWEHELGLPFRLVGSFHRGGR